MSRSGLRPVCPSCVSLGTPLAGVVCRGLDVYPSSDSAKVRRLETRATSSSETMIS